jgi:hypothetical protein
MKIGFAVFVTFLSVLCMMFSLNEILCFS